MANIWRLLKNPETRELAIVGLLPILRLIVNAPNAEQRLGNLIDTLFDIFAPAGK